MPRGLNIIYIIIIVLVCLLFLVLFTIFLVVLIVMAIRRKKKKRLRSHIYSEIGNSSDPIYEAVATVPEVTTSEVEVVVVPNESYGLVESAASGVTYDSVNITIKQSYKNLAITLP